MWSKVKNVFFSFQKGFGVGRNSDFFFFISASFSLQIVRTLCLFLTPSERKCSRLCRADSSFKYDTGLFVQGLLKVAATSLSSHWACWLCIFSPTPCLFCPLFCSGTISFCESQICCSKTLLPASCSGQMKILANSKWVLLFQVQLNQVFRGCRQTLWSRRSSPLIHCCFVRRERLNTALDRLLLISTSAEWESAVH